jgi:hypothetical protein
MKIRRWCLPLAGSLVLLLGACSEPQAPVKKAEEKPVPVTGDSALFKMFQVAHTWDARPEVLKLTSSRAADVPEERGKAPVWECTFVSRALNRSRTFTYSVVELLPNLHKGVFQVAEDAYTFPKNASSTPFSIEAVKIDTDQAYQTALEKAGDYEKKNPGKPIIFVLELTPRYPAPAWRVIWGESPSTSNFSVFVDAGTGKFLEVMH